MSTEPETTRIPDAAKDLLDPDTVVGSLVGAIIAQNEAHERMYQDNMTHWRNEDRAKLLATQAYLNLGLAYADRIYGGTVRQYEDALAIIAAAARPADSVWRHYLAEIERIESEKGYAFPGLDPIAEAPEIAELRRSLRVEDRLEEWA